MMTRKNNPAAADTDAPFVPFKGTFGELLASMRPKQWTKNLLVFTALVFAGRMENTKDLTAAGLTFLAFCLLASANYLINDVFDKIRDQYHPFKRLRPIASGSLRHSLALGVAALLTAFSLIIAAWVDRQLLMVAAGFALLGFTYTAIFKHVVIVDIFVVAGGMLLRIAAGALAIDVPVSAWLLICTLLLALFLGINSRSLEIKILGDNVAHHRPVLGHYNRYLLDQMSSVITSAILITYTLYTLSTVKEGPDGALGLFLTVPIVLYGIFRALYLVHQKEMETSTLEGAIITDRPMMISLLIYAITAFTALYLR